MSIIPCPTWCDGQCTEWDDSYHALDVGDVPATSHKSGPVDVAVSVGRTDDDGTAGVAEVHLLSIGKTRVCADDFRLTPAAARRMAGMLLAAATAADTGRVEATAPGWCPRCGCEQPIRGRVVRSAAGVVRVRNGRCTACGKGKCYATLRTVANQTAGARVPATV